MSSGLGVCSIPPSLVSFSPFRGLTGGAGRPRSKPLLSSSASVPLSLGDVESFRLLRLSASKNAVPLYTTVVWFEENSRGILWPLA